MTRSTTGRAAVAAAALALALAGCSSGGGSSDAAGSTSGGSKPTVDVQLMQFQGQAYRVPIAIAQEQGYFEDAGINLSLVEQPANLQGMQALIATGSQVGNFASATFAQGVQAGIQAETFCGGVDVLSNSLVALPDSNLPTSSDGENWESVLEALDGMTIGVQTPVGSAFQLLVAKALEEVGVTNVTYVNLGAAPTGIQAALENNSVDVAVANPPGLETLVINGVAEELLNLAQGPSVYKDTLGSVYAAPTDWLDANPEAAKGFCDAITEALAYIADSENADDVLQVVSTELGVPANVAEEVILSYETYSTKLDEPRLQTTVDIYTELGILKPEPKVTADVLIWDE